MSGDEAALLAAIIAAPQDDLPRLVYADWLDERGEESDAAQAEYIRLEIELARADPGERPTTGRGGMGKRSAALLARHGAAWFPALSGRGDLLDRSGGYIDYWRGFPYRVTAPADRLLLVGDELTRCGLITSAKVRDLDGDLLGRLGESPWVGRLRGADLFPARMARPIDWGALADAPHLGDLEELELSGGTLSAEAARRLADADPLPRLYRLELFVTTDPAAVVALLGGPAFARLESLRILGVPLRGWVGDLARGACWPGLRRLDLCGCDLRGAGLAELTLAAPAGLRALGAGDNGLTPKAVWP